MLQFGDYHSLSLDTEPPSILLQVALVVKNLLASLGDARDVDSTPGSGRSRNREWKPTPVFLPGKFHRQRSVAGYSPWGCKESDMTKRLSTASSERELDQTVLSSLVKTAKAGIPVVPASWALALSSQSEFCLRSPPFSHHHFYELFFDYLWKHYNIKKNVLNAFYLKIYLTVKL